MLGANEELNRFFGNHSTFKMYKTYKNVCKSGNFENVIIVYPRILTYK